jgi:uncharacterized protein (TIGR03437 family)
MRERKPKRRLRLQVCSAWLIVAAPGICASFSGVVLTDGGSPVSAATVRWNNQAVCVPTPPHGTPACAPPTIIGSAKTSSDGSFAALNLPADTYTVCAAPGGGYLLDSCEWPSPGSTSSVKLADNEDRTGIQIILRSGSLIVIRVMDPLNATSSNFFLPGVIVGAGGYFRANYDTIRQAYTCLILKGIPAYLFFDTLLVVQDGDGNSVPIDTAVLPFTTSGDEVPLSVSVMPALVNAASYIPGVTSGTLATLFGSGFTNTQGIQVASGFPLPTQLSGTSVKVNGIPAPLFAVAEQDGRGQINFQVPHLPSYAEQLAIVVDNNGKEQTFYVRNWASQLGIFSSLAHVSGEPITAVRPAQPGEQITIYWTEISGYDFEYSPGGSSTFIPDGMPSPPSIACVSYSDPQVKIGDIPADVSTCSAAAGLVGIGQLVVTVPPNLASGDYDVTVTLAHVKGNIVRLPVRVP